MANILTVAEAASLLRCEEDDEQMLDLLGQVDKYIQTATGRDWTADTVAHATAKSAARMLLVRWYEDPGGMAHMESMGQGLRAALVQLEAEARRYYTFEGLSSAGWVSIPGATVGDEVVSVTAILNGSGDASASFAGYVEYADILEQTSSSDLSGIWYRAYLKPLGDQ